MSLNKCQVIKYPSSSSISPTCLSFDLSAFGSCQIGAPEAVVRRNISSKSWVCHLLNTDPSNPLGMQFLFRRTTSISLKIKKTMISHILWMQQWRAFSELFHGRLWSKLTGLWRLQLSLKDEGTQWPRRDDWLGQGLPSTEKRKHDICFGEQLVCKILRMCLHAECRWL